MGQIVIPSATTTERISITPDSGELIYDETLRQVYLGDGSTVGGKLVRGGLVNTNSNAGVTADGQGLVLSKSGVNTPIKRILAGSNVTITEEANNILISTVGGPTSNELFEGTFSGTAVSTPYSFSGTLAADTNYTSTFTNANISTVVENTDTSVYDVNSGTGLLTIQQAGRFILEVVPSINFIDFTATASEATNVFCQTSFFIIRGGVVVTSIPLSFATVSAITSGSGKRITSLQSFRLSTAVNLQVGDIFAGGYILRHSAGNLTTVTGSASQIGSGIIRIDIERIS